MNKKGTKTILILGVIILTVFVGFWLTYYFSMEKANEEGLRRQCFRNINQEFKGKLIDINRFEYDSFMHNRFFNLSIKTNDSISERIDYHYNITPYTRSILDFAVIGQTVMKERGKDTFTLTDSLGRKRQFKIAKCD